MLLHYKFSNYRSFNDKVEFDMIATKTKAKNRYLDNFISTVCGENVLKTAVIIGENAGGKSNFIDSFRFLKTLFKENGRARSKKSCINRQRDFLFGENNQAFEIEVIAEDSLIYNYEVQIDSIGIVKEKLQYRTKINHVPKLVFESKRNDIKKSENKDSQSPLALSVSYSFDMGHASKEVEDFLKPKLESNYSLGLFVCSLALLGVDHTIPFVNWMNETLEPVFKPLSFYSERKYNLNENDFNILRDERYNEIFRLVDYSIQRVVIDEDNPFDKSRIIRKDAQGVEYECEIANDSSGVYEFFDWAIQIYKVIYMNKVVFADEMDRVLNPILSDRIIAYIHSKKHTGQFVFSSHNVLHLNLKTFMKEQIYFITKDKNKLESELYSLADFPEIRYENANIYEFYMKGILGGTAFE